MRKLPSLAHRRGVTSAVAAAAGLTLLLSMRATHADDAPKGLATPPEVKAFLAAWKKDRRGDEWADYRSSSGEISSGSTTIRYREFHSTGGGRTTPRTVADPETLFDELTISRVTVCDDTYTIGTRTFACKKLTFDCTPKAAHAGDPARSTSTLWWSSEAKGSPLVAQLLVTQMKIGDGLLASRMELVGFGTGATVEWGREMTPAERRPVKKTGNGGR